MTSCDPSANHRRVRPSRIVLAGCLAVAAVVVTACGGSRGTKSTSSADYEMRIGLATAPTYFQYPALQKFAADVSAATKGHVKVSLFPSSALGSETAMLQSLQSGALQGYSGSTDAATGIVPALGILDTPYLFKTQDAVYQVEAGQLGTSLSSQLDAKSIHVLGWFTGGALDLFGQFPRTVSTPADLAGAKVRVTGSQIVSDAISAWGATPVSVQFSELVLALKTGTVQGVSTNIVAALAAKLDQVSSQFVLTNHVFGPAMFSVSSSWWKSLPADYQTAINGAAATAVQNERDQAASDYTTALETLKTEGKKVTTPNRAAFAAVARTKVWPNAVKSFGLNNVNLILTSQSVPPLSS